MIDATSNLPDLDFTQAQGSNFKGTTMVRVPGENFGGVTVQLDEKGKVTSVMEMHNTINKDGTVTSDTFVDGTQIASIVLVEKTARSSTAGS